MARAKKGREMTDSKSEMIIDWELPSNDDVLSLMVALRIAYRALEVRDFDLNGHISKAEAEAVKSAINEAADTFGTLAVICAAGRDVFDRATDHAALL
jgi:hypothetical protein